MKTGCFPLRLPGLAVALAGLLLAGAAQAEGQLLCPAGRADDYDTTDGPEPASPSAALQSRVASIPGGLPLRGGFDECTRNYVFAHTLTGCALDSNVTQAILTLRLRGTPTGETYSDRLILGAEGVFRWGIRMSTLQTLRTGGADTQWSSTDSATFVLDLGNLPPSDSPPSGWPSWPVGVTSVLPFLAQAGELDITLHDDTCFDYLTLAVSSPTPARSSTWGELKVRYR